MIAMKLVLPMGVGMGLLTLGSQPALTQSPTGSALENVPLCFMVGNDGQLRNLSQLCAPNSMPEGTAARGTPSGLAPEMPGLTPTANLGGLVNQSPNPQATPCFGLDAQGRPCQ